jgi:hypothetical protein
MVPDDTVSTPISIKMTHFLKVESGPYIQIWLH